MPLSRISRACKLNFLLSQINKSSNILEVGSGSGWFSGRLREAGHAVKTLDLRPPADFVGDIRNWRKLGLAPASFDGVVALEVIEHADCWEDLKSLCRPGGWIFLSSPVPRFDWVCRLLETACLLQRRTSPHDHLVDFRKLDPKPSLLKLPLGIHQVGFFRMPA